MLQSKITHAAEVEEESIYRDMHRNPSLFFAPKELSKIFQGNVDSPGTAGVEQPLRPVV